MFEESVIVSTALRDARRKYDEDKFVQFLKECNALLEEEVRDLEKKKKWQLAMRAVPLN